MVLARPLGAHVTIGQPVVLPVASAAPPNLLLLVPAAVICVVLSILAIAATVVLSLIPIYTRHHDVNVTCSSNAYSSAFNLNGGVLPNGQLTTGNRNAFQSTLNQYIAGQSGYSRCTTQLNNGNIDTCSGQRLLLRKRRRLKLNEQNLHLVRKVRQTNNNCNSQQLSTTMTLDCGCVCVGACLNRKAAKLQNLLLYASFPTTFPEPNSTTIPVTGLNVVTSPTTSTVASVITAAMTG